MDDGKILLGKRSKSEERDERFKREVLLQEGKWYKRLFSRRTEKTDPLENKYEEAWLPPIEHLNRYESFLPWVGVYRAYKRCLSEELDLSKKYVRRVRKHRIRVEDDEHNYKIDAYLVRPEPEIGIHLNWEHTEFGYFTPSQIQQMSPQNLLPHFDSLLNILTNSTHDISYTFSFGMSNFPKPYAVPMGLLTEPYKLLSR